MGEGGHTWAQRGRVSQGAMYALQAWEACSGYQDEHT